MVEMITGGTLAGDATAWRPSGPKVQSEDPAAPVVVLAVVEGIPPIAERYIQSVGIGLVWPAPEDDPDGAERPGLFGALLDQRAPDPSAPRSLRYREAGEFRLAGQRHRAAPRRRRMEGDHSDQLAVLVLG